MRKILILSLLLLVAALPVAAQSAPPAATPAAIRDFMEQSMAGLTGHGWSTPENWIMVDGPRVVSQWDQVLGNDADGNPWVVPGLSILYYAGNGLFCYSHDMLNMTHIGQTMRDMGWRPPKEFNMPPRKPNWSTELPLAWRGLPDAFTNQGK